MDTSELDFDLPQELIAQFPSAKRGRGDRLLVVNKNENSLTDLDFLSFPSFFSKDDVLVLNNSKVRKARVYVQSEKGKKVEFLFIRSNSDGLWEVVASKSKRIKDGERFFLENSESVFFTCKKDLGDGVKLIEPNGEIEEEFFDSFGHVPLPPYIKREDKKDDEFRYQTVYAKKDGSVACPTAGLHFTKNILDSISENGTKIYEVTLHVGMGTFLPIRGKTLEEHKMHSEEYTISPDVAKAITEAKRDGKKITCAGTTTLRTLESAWSDEKKCLEAGNRFTDIFIKPGYKFKVCDRLLTNFHTPGSTLLALVYAFEGKELINRAYRHAIEENYRFFSYGDATFLI